MDKDTQRRANKIGSQGEYALPATIRQEGRKRFLDYLIKREPRILTDLAEQVWPVFNLVFPDDLVVLLENDDTETEKALRAWADTWHFIDDWCLTQAVATLSRWHYQGQPTPERGWGINEVVILLPPLTDDERRFGFQDPGWEATTQTWSAFESELDQEYERWKAAYRQYVENLVQQRGAIRSPVKHGFEHFDWLARYHLGDSVNKLAKDEHRDRATVLEGIRSAAELISLTLPKDRAGKQAPKIRWNPWLAFRGRNGEQEELPWGFSDSPLILPVGSSKMP